MTDSMRWASKKPVCCSIAPMCDHVWCSTCGWVNDTGNGPSCLHDSEEEW